MWLLREEPTGSGSNSLAKKKNILSYLCKAVRAASHDAKDMMWNYATVPMASWLRHWPSCSLQLCTRCG